jgi:hypothetical protein
MPCLAQYGCKVSSTFDTGHTLSIVLRTWPFFTLRVICQTYHSLIGVRTALPPQPYQYRTAVPTEAAKRLVQWGGPCGHSTSVQIDSES